MKAVKEEEQTKIDSVCENNVKNETLTTELHFELLKQYAWLSSAVIGAIIIVAQLSTVEMGKYIYISLGFLGGSIFISLIGQDHIVDSLLKGKYISEISKTLKLMRVVSMACLGLGVGFFLGGIFFN